MTRFCCFILVLIAASTASAAAAQCDVRGEIVTSALGITYDPFSPTRQVMDITVSVSNAGNEPCQARIYIKSENDRQELVSASGTLDFRLDGQPGGGGPNAGEVGPFVLNLLAGRTGTIVVRATVTPRQIQPRGTYTNNLTLRLTDQKGESLPLTGSLVRLQADVLERAEVSISGASGQSGGGIGTSLISFGEARTGKTQHANINVWSNGSYVLSIDSENDGLLRLPNDPQLTPITYSARIDGVDISLAGVTMLPEARPTKVNGTSRQMVLTLGEVAGNFAGDYKDVITVSVVQN